MMLAASTQDLSHRYRRRIALESIALDLRQGSFVALIGPDGVGKSTLLAILAGAKQIQTGEVYVLGGDMSGARHRRAICARVAYMPQGLGRNLYPDLSVCENITFFARLFGQGAAAREPRICDLLESTGLAPFKDRAAKQLSGGMRQKLGLCCALVHDPDLLILDEPTTGVDPLSRRQFWDLIARMREQRPDMTVIVSTAYMEEAERFELAGRDECGGHSGQRYTSGDYGARQDARRWEASFVALLPAAARAGHLTLHIPPRSAIEAEPAIVARELTRRFGDFTAADRVSFTIARGEIFGFVGSNGCGKTTTMKMLTGLLPATAGEAILFGHPVNAHECRAASACRLYVAVIFALYGTDGAAEPGSACSAVSPAAGLRPSRIAALIEQFGLAEHVDSRGSRSAAWHPPATVARGCNRARARSIDPRRADLGCRSLGTGRVLGAADRSVAQAGRDHLRLDAFHERGGTLRSHRDDACGARAREREAGRTDCGSLRDHSGGCVYFLSPGNRTSTTCPRRCVCWHLLSARGPRQEAASGGCWPI